MVLKGMTSIELEVSSLNKEYFVKMLGHHAKFKALSLENILTASDETRKILFRLDDGLVLETVVIPCNRGRTTICVPSQVDCAMNCQFCYTRRMGEETSVHSWDSRAGSICTTSPHKMKVSRISPKLIGKLHSEQAPEAQYLKSKEWESHLKILTVLIKAANIMVPDQGLHFSPRKVTVSVSTSGLVPQLKHFLHESNCALAVSLNATTDEIRNWIVPINRKYNLRLLLQTLREELRLKNIYKVLFEYVMLEGGNDSVDDAKRLVDIVQGIPCKINPVQFNPHCGSQFRPTSAENMIKFRRYSRGDDQMAACGQLGKPRAIQSPLLRVPEQFQMAVNA